MSFRQSIVFSSVTLHSLSEVQRALRGGWDFPILGERSRILLVLKSKGRAGRRTRQKLQKAECPVDGSTVESTLKQEA